MWAPSQPPPKQKHEVVLPSPRYGEDRGGGGGGGPAGGGGTSGGTVPLGGGGDRYGGCDPLAMGIWFPLAYMHCIYVMS